MVGYLMLMPLMPLTCCMQLAPSMHVKGVLHILEAGVSLLCAVHLSTLSLSMHACAVQAFWLLAQHAAECMAAVAAGRAMLRWAHKRVQHLEGQQLQPKEQLKHQQHWGITSKKVA